MKNWTLRKLLTFGFAGPVILILILAGAFFFSLFQLNRFVSHIVDDNVPGLTISNQLKTEAMRYRVATLRHLMTSDAATMEACEAECAARSAEFTRLLDAYEQTVRQAEDRQLFAQVGPIWKAYVAVADEARQLNRQGDKTAAADLVRAKGNDAIAAVEQAAEALVGYNEKAAAAAAAGIGATVRASRFIATAVSSIAILLELAAAVLITRSISRTLQRVSTALEDTSSQVTAAAAQVASASQSLAGGASEQAASLEETSASIEELSGMTARNSESAQQTKELSSQTRTAADTCANDMQAMTAAMDDIKSSSSDISQIIKTIDEIAFQTNILALNAAVEAARAGEAGMGFAVVADEVRGLAQRCAQSARETADKIAVAITKSEHGVRLSDKVAHSLTEILDKARQVDGLVAEIATASHEQSQGIGQVNTTVSQMDKVTQATASNAEETAAAAEELSAQALAMRESVTDLRRLIDGSSAATASRSGAARPPRAASPEGTTSARLRRPLLRKPVLEEAEDDLHFEDISPNGRNGHHHANGATPPGRNGTNRSGSDRNGAA